MLELGGGTGSYKLCTLLFSGSKVPNKTKSGGPHSEIAVGRDRMVGFVAGKAGNSFVFTILICKSDKVFERSKLL